MTERCENNGSNVREAGRDVAGDLMRCQRTWANTQQKTEPGFDIRGSHVSDISVMRVVYVQ